MMFYHSLYGTDEFFVYMFDESERLANAPFYALNLFILIWSSDTFAYLAGRAFGKHKLFESVSPKKTWEGLIGGTILTMVFSMVLSYYFKIPYAMNALIAALTVVFGTLGDLVESMLKRQYNVKDSGNILPGHGGILDRFDALLVSLPFTTLVYYLTFRL
jgi:phosphatidate cytidylyltransferase